MPTSGGTPAPAWSKQAKFPEPETRGFRLIDDGGAQCPHDKAQQRVSVVRGPNVWRIPGREAWFVGVRALGDRRGTPGPPSDQRLGTTSTPPEAGTARFAAPSGAAQAAFGTNSSNLPRYSVGGVTRSISPDELPGLVHEIAITEVIATGARRVLLVPPDGTRRRSRAGEITGFLFEDLTGAGCDVAVLPALGTHSAMEPGAATQVFGGRVPFDRILRHRCREGVVRLGEIGAGEVTTLSAGRFSDPIPVDIDELALERWDLVVSIGQVVPHEVTGMANYSKNLVIGLGGVSTINRTHFLGAVCGMETIMGRVLNPVRGVVDAAFDRFVAPRVPVLWILTVVQDGPAGIEHRGLFVGHGRSDESGGAAFRTAAGLAQRCNVEVLEQPLRRVTCWIDPSEFGTTWLANKAIYRSRMALADGAELIVLAPGVCRFGEDATMDTLIRRHGYRGTPAILAAVRSDPELADNLGAAAHLIHGSSEGRFRVVYCTDPATGGLTRDEVESVGYAWRDLAAELARLGVTEQTPTGARLDRDGAPFDHIANPALGLWTTTARFT
jgi:nickel-dependent lactate racemase